MSEVSMKAYVIYDTVKVKYVSGRRRWLFESVGAAKVSCLKRWGTRAYWPSRRAVDDWYKPVSFKDQTRFIIREFILED